jgi:DNA-binding GntR family transcriptional regulator
VTTVYERLLEAVHHGDLLPGQRISDAELAARFGVSRTPVREALQRLRDIGIIEASASRFTRVSVVTPVQTTQAFIVWLALYGALVDEVIDRVPASTLSLMESDMADFSAHLDPWDPEGAATTNFTFFSRLMQLSENPALQRSINGVVHIIRLGSLHLPRALDMTALAGAQRMLTDAARRHDLGRAHEALTTLRAIEIPLD